MLCSIAERRVVVFEVGNRLVLNILKYNGLGVRTDSHAQIFSDDARRRGDRRVWGVSSYGKIVDDHSGNLRVHVALSRLPSHVAFKAVPSVEEFADISANVVLEDKSTAWVLVNELFNVKDKLIKND